MMNARGFAIPVPGRQVSIAAVKALALTVALFAYVASAQASVTWNIVGTAR